MFGALNTDTFLRRTCDRPCGVPFVPPSDRQPRFLLSLTESVVVGRHLFSAPFLFFMLQSRRCRCGFPISTLTVGMMILIVPAFRSLLYFPSVLTNVTSLETPKFLRLGFFPLVDLRFESGVSAYASLFFTWKSEILAHFCCAGRRFFSLPCLSSPIIRWGRLCLTLPCAFDLASLWEFLTLSLNEERCLILQKALSSESRCKFDPTPT